ncbi:MAG TPA: phospholipase D-like domain-containing protein [Anaerolineae bacterium]|nr:phospholipase D-like domain-containing protein [Anaerolineae bacterium]
MSRKSSSSSLKLFGLSAWVIIGILLIGFCIFASVILFSGRGIPGQVSELPSPTFTRTVAPPTAVDVTKLARANVSQGAWYTAYFTIPSYPEKADKRTGGIDQAIVADIDGAQKTIDAAVFDVRLPSLVDALTRAAQRGVQVRMVVDYDANKDAQDFTNAIDQLEQGGVKVVRDERSALMHDKFIVIDKQILWAGSMNFTPNDVYRNNNNMLRLMTHELIDNYNTRFDWLFNGRGKNGTTKEIPNPRITLDNGVVIENYFSPSGGAQKAILDHLKAAQKSIRVTAFSFTDPSIGNVLISKTKDKLLVQGVFETRNNTGLGADYDRLVRSGVDILQDGNCYILHSKTMVIDDHIVITGSYNFTESANKTNDENLLIIDDPSLAKLYIDEFNRIRTQAKKPTKCGAGFVDDNSGGE